MKPTFFATPADFRAWFEANHSSAKELLVGFYKRGSGKPSITWPESVDEALCFGWIDGVRKSIDEDAYTIRFTPRKPTSIWSAINVAKVAALEKLGRMTPAGRRAFEARTDERTGVYSFERNEAATLASDDERKLRANRKAAEFFDAQPPWYRRTSIHWVTSAKREETRRRRLDRLIDDSAQGRTIGPLTRTPPERTPKTSVAAAPKPKARRGAKARSAASSRVAKKASSRGKRAARRNTATTKPKRPNAPPPGRRKRTSASGEARGLRPPAQRRAQPKR